MTNDTKIRRIAVTVFYLSWFPRGFGVLACFLRFDSVVFLVFQNSAVGGIIFFGLSLYRSILTGSNRSFLVFHC